MLPNDVNRSPSLPLYSQTLTGPIQTQTQTPTHPLSIQLLTLIVLSFFLSTFQIYPHTKCFVIVHSSLCLPGFE